MGSRSTNGLALILTIGFGLGVPFIVAGYADSFFSAEARSLQESSVVTDNVEQNLQRISGASTQLGPISGVLRFNYDLGDTTATFVTDNDLVNNAIHNATGTQSLSDCLPAKATSLTIQELNNKLQDVQNALNTTAGDCFKAKLGANDEYVHSHIKIVQSPPFKVYLDGASKFFVLLLTILLWDSFVLLLLKLHKSFREALRIEIDTK